MKITEFKFFIDYIYMYRHLIHVHAWWGGGGGEGSCKGPMPKCLYSVTLTMCISLRLNIPGERVITDSRSVHSLTL